MLLNLSVFQCCDAGCFHLKEGLWKRREREREAQAEAQHSLHGLNPLEIVKILNEENNYRELFEQARKCAEVARYVHCLGYLYLCFFAESNPECSLFGLQVKGASQFTH